MKELRIVIADDSVIVRDQLRWALSPIDGCSILGMAEDGSEAVNMVKALKPDLVVLDISMPHRNGIQVLREIRQEDPTTVIIMFTADPSIVLREVCLEAGANFYLDKFQIQELIDICQEQLLKR